MVKTRELSLAERNQIIGMFKSNMKKVQLQLKWALVSPQFDM